MKAHRSGYILMSCLVCLILHGRGSGSEIERRIGRIDSLLNRLTNEIGALKWELENGAGRDSAEKRVTAADTMIDTIAELLLPDKQREIIALKPRNLNRTGFGFTIAHHLPDESDYSFPYYDEDGRNRERYLRPGLSVQHWIDSWGIRITGGFSKSKFIDYAFLYAAALRSLKRFYIRDWEFTHIYAVGEIGFTGRQGYYWPPPEPDSSPPDNSYYYSYQELSEAKAFSVPTTAVHMHLGFATDFNIFDGLKISPEVGVRCNYYLTRYHDSKEYPPSWPGRSGMEAPKQSSAVSIIPAFGATIYLFFR